MSSNAQLQPEPAPITACTVCRDVQNFDLLIEDMESELGESWGDLSFADAIPFFGQPEGEFLEFIAIAMDSEDEVELDLITDVITDAKARDIRIVLIAEDVSPSVLHQLLRQGADEFLPYPLPENALTEAIEKMKRASIPATAAAAPGVDLASGGDKDGVILPVHGLSGGVGATTFATNLAWELANPPAQRKKKGEPEKEPPKVCLIDLDMQTGTCATYLDLPRKDLIYELLSDIETMDAEAFMTALVTHQDRMQVFTAPAEMLPLDLLDPEGVERMLDIARSNFDYVVIDMPTAVVSWTETVLHAAHVYFTLLELDMRSAQNCLRFLRLLKGEDMPVEKLRFGMNRAPGFTDLQGKARIKRMAESLDIDIELLLPDGQKPVLQANDHGLPLSVNAGKNPLRKEIAKLATSLHELVSADSAIGG